MQQDCWLGTIWITGKLSASAWSLWGHVFKSDEFKTLIDGKLPQEVAGIAGNRINMGSLCMSSKNSIYVIVKWLRKQTTRTKWCFCCREEETRETWLSSKQIFKYWSPLAKDIAAFQETATGWQLLYSHFLELLYQNTAPSIFKEDINKLEISKSTYNPSANKPKQWNSW